MVPSGFAGAPAATSAATSASVTGVPPARVSISATRAGDSAVGVSLIADAGEPSAPSRRERDADFANAPARVPVAGIPDCGVAGLTESDALEPAAVPATVPQDAGSRHRFSVLLRRRDHDGGGGDSVVRDNGGGNECQEQRQRLHKNSPVLGNRTRPRHRGHHLRRRVVLRRCVFLRPLGSRRVPVSTRLDLPDCLPCLPRSARPPPAPEALPPTFLSGGPARLP